MSPRGVNASEVGGKEIVEWELSKKLSPVIDIREVYSPLAGSL